MLLIWTNFISFGFSCAFRVQVESPTCLLRLFLEFAWATGRDRVRWNGGGLRNNYKKKCFWTLREVYWTHDWELIENCLLGASGQAIRESFLPLDHEKPKTRQDEWEHVRCSKDQKVAPTITTRTALYQGFTLHQVLF